MPVFTAVNEAMSPVPAAPRPIAVFEFVHVNTVPGTAPVKAIALVAAPPHNVWSAVAPTVGRGLTVIVNAIGAPVQIAPP